MRRLAALGAALLLGAVPAHAISVTATPIHHGVLRIAKSGGTMDKASGIAQITVTRWSIVLAPSSDGIYPDQEPIVVAIGDDSFRLEAGMVRAVNGRTFRYKAPKKPALARGVQSLVIRRLGPKSAIATSYAIEFKVRGVQLFDLSRKAPLCLPTAFIVGDDDGFVGVSYDSPGSPPIVSRRVVAGEQTCPVETWPWA